MSNLGILEARRHIKELSTELCAVRKLVWRTSHIEDHVTALETAIARIKQLLAEETA
jgi:hypothetical protein